MNMRAKFSVISVTEHRMGGLDSGAVVQETIEAIAVTSKPFDKEGHNEDNTFAKYTPNARLTMTILNPALFGQYRAGVKMYADFTIAPNIDPT